MSREYEADASINQANEVFNEACGERFEGMECSSYGELHFETFSGKHFTAMGHGEYIIAQNPAKSFSVHACHQPTVDSLSENTGVVIKSQWGVLKYNNPNLTPKIPEGSGIVFKEHAPSFGINTIIFPSGEVVMTSNNGGVTTIQLASAYCDNVYGLCGAYKPDDTFFSTLTVNDFNLPDGPTVWSGESTDQFDSGPFGGTFQSDFIDSWKVTAGSSDALFTAAECPSAPSPVGDAVPVPFKKCPSLEAQAREKCPDGQMFESCLADVGLTCELKKWLQEMEELAQEQVFTPASISLNGTGSGSGSGDGGEESDGLDDAGDGGSQTWSGGEDSYGSYTSTWAALNGPSASAAAVGVVGVVGTEQGEVATAEEKVQRQGVSAVGWAGRIVLVAVGLVFAIAAIAQLRRRRVGTFDPGRLHHYAHHPDCAHTDVVALAHHDRSEVLAGIGIEMKLSIDSDETTVIRPGSSTLL
jgi:hypothetical protein